jgi:hypothetical protein
MKASEWIEVNRGSRRMTGFLLLRVAAFLFYAAFCSSLCGCIMYEGRRSPDIVGRGAKVDVRSAPRIDVRIEHRHTMDGRIVGDLSYRAIEDSFQRVRQEFPFLANTQLRKKNPEYVLVLKTQQAEYGEAMAKISGFTLTIFPALIHTQIIVAGDLERADGEEVGSYRAIGELRGVVQILLILALPALPFTAPGDELYDDTFRDFFLQLAPDLDASLEVSPG